MWLCRAIRAPFVICDIKATLFLSTLASSIDLWQPAWRPALKLAVRHRLVSFGTHEPERQGGEADVNRFSPLMAERKRASGRARGKEGGGSRGSLDKRGTLFLSGAGEQAIYFRFMAKIIFMHWISTFFVLRFILPSEINQTCQDTIKVI